MTEPLTAYERAGLVHDAASQFWRDSPDKISEFDGHVLVFDEPPGQVFYDNGELGGVDAWIRLFDPSGKEVRVDPHRRIVNPPTTHRDLGSDPFEAWLQTVWDSVIRTPHRRGWRSRSGTVDTFFSATTDGQIEGNSATYSLAREGTGTLTTTTNATNEEVGQFFSSTYSCFEVFISFDTSAITDTDIVTSVTLDMWLVTNQNISTWDVEARTHDWGASLTNADYVAGSALGTKTLLSSIAANTIGSTGSYKTFPSSANFLVATNIKTGTVYILLNTSAQRNNVAPSAADRVFFSMADNTGTTQDPKLTITHNVPASSPFFTGRPLRIYRKGRT